MFKKLLVAVALFSGVAISANAQQYTFVGHTIDSTTTGTTPPDFVAIYNYATNVTASDSIQLTWSIISNDIPTGWVNSGICDNINCFGDAGTLQGLVAHTTKKFGHNQTCQFTADVQAPTTAANGVATIKVRTQTTIVNGADVTDGQVDTITFILRKVSPTGVAVIKGNDARVTLSPNPANNSLVVFADKALNASKISVINITGQVVYTTAVVAETSNLNINGLAKGTYMVRIVDNKGQLVTTRKFLKD